MYYVLGLFYQTLFILLWLIRQRVLGNCLCSGNVLAQANSSNSVFSWKYNFNYENLCFPQSVPFSQSLTEPPPHWATSQPPFETPLGYQPSKASDHSPLQSFASLHPPPLFSDSKFNTKNSPSLWLSPEVDGYQGQREHIHTIYMQLAHNLLQNSQEMSGHWWAEHFLLSSFIISSGFLALPSSQAAMQSGSSGSQVIQRGGSRGGSRTAGRYTQTLVPPGQWQHFRSAVSRDLCQRLPHANLCQNTEQLPLSEKAGTTEQPTNLSWWQANAILCLASCWGTLSLWAQKAACKSGFSLRESCSISIQESR